VQAADGHGPFVQHHGLTEGGVRANIAAGLASLPKVANEQFSPLQMRCEAACVAVSPTCALVALIIKEAWMSTAPKR
jgi:hypothetical protein